MPKKPAVAPPPVVLLEKTFGQIDVARPSYLAPAYKSIKFLVLSGESLTSPSSHAPPYDYLLLTSPNTIVFDGPVGQSLRKKIKIIGNSKAKTQLQGKGFRQVKVLGAGQKVLLKKDGAHIFVGSVPFKDGNAYFLEFDNGRNVLFAGDVANADHLREFLYAVRDDGKTIHMVLLNDSATTMEQKVEILSLLQPQLAVLVADKKVSDADSAALYESLKQNFFNGNLYFAKKGDKIPF